MGKKFDRLMHHVAREYEERGMGNERAEEIGRAVAGKVAREKGQAPGQDEHDARGADGVQP